MDKIVEILPFLIPLLVVELLLIIVALVHIFRHKNYRFGNRIMWVIIVLFIQIIGPVLYFVIGRSDE